MVPVVFTRNERIRQDVDLVTARVNYKFRRPDRRQVLIFSIPIDWSYERPALAPASFVA